MKDQFSQYAIPSMMRTPTDEFVNMMDMLMLIDIGTIQAVNAAGRATVISSKTLGGEPVVLEDVEVIGIGNAGGGFIVDGTGTACLILVPRACMPDLSNLKVDWSIPLFSKNGIKALPITNGKNLSVTAGITSEGTFCISTGTYIVAFEKNRVNFTQQGMFIDIGSNGNISLLRKSENSGLYELSISDAGVSHTFTNKNNTSKYTFSLLDDGSLNIIHTKPGQEEQVLNTISIDADGVLTISTKENLSLSTEGDLALSAGGNVTIDSGDGKSVSINGTNLEVSK